MKTTKTPEEILLFENAVSKASYMLHRDEKNEIVINVFVGGKWQTRPYTLNNHSEFHMLPSDVIHIDER
jgi:hypothetical protein